ncbi:12697_t:CDS:2 [Entrophospora sp. SA101]|nr:12697_t:CDS:2 [Entrophospora sp. SA101]CAJ0841417.1 19133_t:CDS:2 [Entrophospora sp. SA101]
MSQLKKWERNRFQPIDEIAERVFFEVLIFCKDAKLNLKGL